MAVVMQYTQLVLFKFLTKHCLLESKMEITEIDKYIHISHSEELS